MSLGVLYKVPVNGASQSVSPAAGAAAAPQLLFSGARLPRDTFQLMRMADNVLREAEAEAKTLREQSAAILQAQKRQAQAEGFAQGRAEGMASVLGTLEVERCLRDLLSNRLADVVEHCLRGLLGDLDGKHLLRQRVLQLLRMAGEQPAPTSSASVGISSGEGGTSRLGGATLHVSPTQLALVQAVVAQLKAEAAQAHRGLGLSDVPGSVANLQVVIDPQRAPDSLLLETRFAFIDSSLELTLQEARALLQQSLSHAMQQLESLA